MRRQWTISRPGAPVASRVSGGDLPREITDDSRRTTSRSISRCHRICPRARLSHGVNQVMNSDKSRAGRGDRREPIFQDDLDRQRFVAPLGEACAKTACRCGSHADRAGRFRPTCSCPITGRCRARPTGFHLVVETPQPNLVAGMKWLLGTYTSRFNSDRSREPAGGPNSLATSSRVATNRWSPPPTARCMPTAPTGAPQRKRC